jgi:hypothetical protein
MLPGECSGLTQIGLSLDTEESKFRALIVEKFYEIGSRLEHSPRKFPITRARNIELQDSSFKSAVIPKRTLTHKCKNFTEVPGMRV